MFETLQANHARGPSGPVRALTAAYTICAVILTGLEVASVFAVEAIPSPPISRGAPIPGIGVASVLAVEAIPFPPISRGAPIPIRSHICTIPIPAVQPTRQQLEDAAAVTTMTSDPCEQWTCVFRDREELSDVRPNKLERRVYRVEGDVVAPRLMLNEMPRYTPVMRHSRLAGEVVVEAVIDERGAVGELRLLRSPHPLLTDAAILAMQRWRFAPALLDGRAVPVYFVLRVRFHLK